MRLLRVAFVFPFLATIAFASASESVAPDFDRRLPATEDDLAGFVMRARTVEQQSSAELLLTRLPGAELRWDGMSGAPRWLAAPPGLALSPANPGLPEFTARRFLVSHSALVGISADAMNDLQITDVIGAPDGGARVHFMQRAHGLEVFGGKMLVAVRGGGAVRSLGGSLYARIPKPGNPVISAAEAVRLAAGDLYPDLPFAGNRSTVEDGIEQRTIFEEPAFGRAPLAHLVLFPEREGARLAWEVRIAEPGFFTDYTVLIDAVGGDLLFRRNHTRTAQARVIDAGSPEPHGEEFRPEPYTLLTIPESTPESSQGWISGAGTSLSGNNATSHLDYDSLPGLSDPAALYDYPFGTQESALVNAWYWVNDAHDRFYAAGFDEAAGNFQQDNFGNGGLGGDPMGVVVWAEGWRNNAFYRDGVDGEDASVNMLWLSCATCDDHDGYPENGGDRAGAYDRTVVAHEYAHGVSTRMVGGPATGDCLLGRQSGAMGEGWSDLFPASFYDDPTGADYFKEGLGFIRGLHHDLRYDGFCQDGGCQVHRDGMIWGGTLWDLRNSMAALDPANGLEQFHRIAVEGMAETPCYPTMLDARDGLLQADTTLYGSAHHTVIWNTFAERGMGELASATGEDDTAPVPDHTVPAGHGCTPPAIPTGLTATAEGDNAIRLNYTASGAAAVEIWRDDLDNTIDHAVRIAYTTDTGSYLDTTVQGSKSYRYHLVAMGAGGVTCRSGESSTADATATGPCTAYPRFVPGLTVSDGSIDCALSLAWSAAQEGCPSSGDPIVYNVYRSQVQGFRPSEKLMIDRITGTTLQDTPPQDGTTYYYLVLAQHGTLSDPADHSDRGSAQVMQWVPRLARLGRTTVEYWDFDTGEQGWTTDNSSDPDGAWTVADPTPTYYQDALFAPDEPAGGSGMSWVTGNDTSYDSIADHDVDGYNTLTSPTWSGLTGGTILSFDYWAHTPGGVHSNGIQLQVYSLGGYADLWPVNRMGAQRFEAPGRYGWQRVEVDLAEYVSASPHMQITFVTYPSSLSEYGIDNVRIESGGSCSRSALAIQSVSVDDSPAGWGNGNSLLEPGETARLHFTLVNNGGATAAAPSGLLTGGPSGLVIHTADGTFPDILPAGTGTSLGDGFTVSLPHELACGDTVALTLETTDGAGTVSRNGWFPETGETFTDIVFTDTFETDKGWLVEGAGAGAGIWQRGDPVGTMDGSEQANPEDDSPNDTGGQCYVTENGSVGGDPNLTDVDMEIPYLFSPMIDLTGYKRARANFDLWYHATLSGQDYVAYGAGVDRDGEPVVSTYGVEGENTGGWASRQMDLTVEVPMTSGVRLDFFGRDRDETVYPDWSDGVVEFGVDNISVEADYMVCDMSSVLSPNGIGDTLFVDKSATVDLTWTAAPSDATHDPPAYYDVYVSSAPGSGFEVGASPMGTGATRDLDDNTEYYAVTAVNAAGDSGDRPAP